VTPDEIEQRATAAVLSTGATVGRASFALAAFALAAALARPGLPGVRALLFASLGFGLAQSWYALRVALDARLFDLTGVAENLAALDRVLERLRGSSFPAGRSLAERSRAALGLWRRQAMAAFLQGFCLLAAIGWSLAAR
jgi:hypothetical protein